MLKPELPEIPEKWKPLVNHLLGYFTLDGENLLDCITEGEKVIFYALICPEIDRLQIICTTQYGKSLIVAMACLILTCVMGYRVAVIAPSNEKAKIIMNYYIDHLGDRPEFYRQLEQNTRLERLRQEQSKNKIILRNGGGIFVISTQEKFAGKNIESAMGQGAQIVIGDEFGLISDRTEATIFRMISGKKNGRYIKIGNPFYKLPPYTHFSESWEDPAYYKIFIDYVRAIKEGRYTERFIEEARGKPLFSVMYACEFPPEGEMDEKGYRQLISKSKIRTGITADALLMMIEKEREGNGGRLRFKIKCGADIGGGGDKNVYTIRYGHFAVRVGFNKSNDTMVNISELERLQAIWGFEWEDVNIDDIGIGRGVCDRMIEKGYAVNGVNVGNPASDKEFSNLKAELYFETMNWINHDDTRLCNNPDWSQLLWIKYKVNSDKQFKIEPKEDLKKRTKKSPDDAESLMLTFYEPPFVGIL